MRGLGLFLGFARRAASAVAGAITYTDRIQTEAGDTLTSEAGDPLRTE